MIKTYNIQLVMTPDTMAYWLDQLTTSRDAFNECVRIIYESKTKLTMCAVHNTCYTQLREHFPSLPAQAIIRIQREAMAKLKSIKSNKHKNSALPQKHNLYKRLYSNLDADGIKLPTQIAKKREKCGFVLYNKIATLFSECDTICDPTIFYRDKHMYLSVPFDIPSQTCENDASIGVDLGIKRLFVTSDGTYFSDKAYLKERRKQRYLKRCLQTKGTQSAKKHLRKVRKKEANLSKDMVERATNILLKSTDAGVIVLENLKNIKQKTSKTSEGYKRKRHNNMFSQVLFYQFKERLSHKAQFVGKRVETVSPAFTSKADNRTNDRDGNRIGCRYYCSDGIIFDADWNAAINIAHRAKHPISNDLLPLDGKLTSLIGRVQSITQSSGNR